MYKGERKELRGPKKMKETKVLYDAQKCSTIDAPIPEPPPVIKTTLFSKSKYLAFIYILSSVF